MTHISTSPEQTFGLASRFADGLSAGDTVCLYGELGAGKTAFTKGLASGLGICETVTSPTFTIVSEYLSGRLPLYHFDVYRLGGSDGLEDTAFYDYVGGAGVVVIEWAELIEETLREFLPPGKRIDISLTHDSDGSRLRRISIQRGAAP